jgi:multisubunit Na+/H+ antiporter MnhB subunit
VLVLAVAVLMSWRRAQLVIMIGVGLVVLAVALALLVGVGRDLLSDVIGDDTRQAAFTAGYNTVTESFVTQTAALAAIGVFVGGSGIAMLWRQRRNRRPIGWA